MKEPISKGMRKGQSRSTIKEPITKLKNEKSIALFNNKKNQLAQSGMRKEQSCSTMKKKN